MQPKDYDPDRTDPDFKQEWFGGTAISGRHNGGKDRRIDHLLQGLILAGILALVGIVWTLRDNVTEIRTFVKAKADQYDSDLRRIDKTLDRHDERITAIERGESPRYRKPDNR